ncbi:hypothetical protein [Acetobacterium sp.]|uniref:hypothetical protein n=1 Tax=Acetobacterium sp. TaxID=1872094 RepID=UPI002F405DE6
MSVVIFRDEEVDLVETEPRKPPEDLDDIPWPDITLTNDYKYYGLLPILTGRGCPFGCTFCYEGANAKRVRRHSVPSLMADAGLKKIFFGLESESDQVLKSYNKKTTRKMAVDVIDHCVESGIHGISGKYHLRGTS